MIYQLVWCDNAAYGVGAAKNDDDEHIPVTLHNRYRRLSILIFFRDGRACIVDNNNNSAHARLYNTFRYAGFSFSSLESGDHIGV